MYGLGNRGGTPGGRFGGAFPETAELREDVAEEGMAKAAEASEAAAAAAAAAGTHMEAVLRPMARLLTGPRPEGAETVAEPREEA